MKRNELLLIQAAAWMNRKSIVESRKPYTKQYVLHEPIYVEFYRRQQESMGKSELLLPRGAGSEGITRKGHEGTF